ncbi:MAG: hypothetical protein EAZ08_13880 [Cytophagales bacterium]|nr:MAG: hypothetical protein EAZ08_13880 [Cytophagales bacterium]
MKKGEKAFRKGDYLEALDKFELALDGCDEVNIEKYRSLVRKRKKEAREAIEKMLAGYKESEQKAKDAEEVAKQALAKAELALAEAQQAKKEAEQEKLKAIQYSVEIKKKDENFLKDHQEEIEMALKKYDIEKAKNELNELEVSKNVHPKEIDLLKKKIKETIDQLIPEMVDVKGGTFTMGCTGKDCDDSPEHKRLLTNFRIGKSEVTQGLWKKVMGKDNIPFHFNKCGDECPVESVSYEQVSVFIRELCKKTGKKFRLPTEAEWEYAAIGGHKANQIIAKKKDFEYSGGNNLGVYGWATGKSTNPVGKKKPNQLGIYDMSGNVMEWCEDYYDYRFYNKSKGKLDQVQRLKINRDDRVVRGGAFYNDNHRDNQPLCKVTTRFFLPAKTKSKNLGFRLVQELDEKK